MGQTAEYDLLYLPVLLISLWMVFRGTRLLLKVRSCIGIDAVFAQHYLVMVVGLGAAELTLSCVMVVTGYGHGSDIARFWAGFDIAASMALLLPLRYLESRLGAEQQG